MKSVVFILSPSYSGSTMLGLILGSHSQCEWVGEFSKLKKYNAQAKTYSQAKSVNFCRFCKPGTCTLYLDCNTYEKISERFKGKLLIDTSKKAGWVEKNKKVVHSVIYIDRPHADITASFAKRGIFRKDMAERLRRSKSTRLKVAKKFPHMTVGYKDICNSDGIERVCAFLGLKYEPEMKKFWLKKHHGVGNVNLINGIVDGSIREIRKA